MYQPHKDSCVRGAGAFGCLPKETYLPQPPISRTGRQDSNASVLTSPDLHNSSTECYLPPRVSSLLCPRSPSTQQARDRMDEGDQEEPRSHSLFWELWATMPPRPCLYSWSLTLVSPSPMCLSPPPQPWLLLPGAHRSPCWPVPGPLVQFYFCEGDRSCPNTVGNAA